MRMILPRAIPYLYIFISYHRSNMQNHRIDFARFCTTNLGGVFCFVGDLWSESNCSRELCSSGWEVETLLRRFRGGSLVKRSKFPPGLSISIRMSRFSFFWCSVVRIVPQHEPLRSGAEFESQTHRLLWRPREMRMILPRAIPYLYIFILYHRSNMQDHRIDFARFCATNLGGVFLFRWRPVE